MSTVWSKKRANANSEIFPLLQLNDLELHHISHEFIKRDANELSIEIASSPIQSSFLQSSSSESAVFLDVIQSFALKSLVSDIGESSSYLKLAERLKWYCTLYSSRIDHSFALNLKNTELVHDPSDYVVYPSCLEERAKVFEPYALAMNDSLSIKIIDLLIVSHEIGHYLYQSNSDAIKVEKDWSEYSYDFAIDQVCFDHLNDEDFAYVFGRYGVVEYSKNALKNAREDQRKRRKHYLSNRSHIVEEITCDFYAASSVLSFCLNTLDGGDEQTIIGVFTRVYMAYCYIDLYQAMLRRTKLSVLSNIDDYLPVDIADTNFRKVALIYWAVQSHDRFIANQKLTDQLFIDYFNLVSTMKNCIDDLYVMPVTRIMYNLFTNAEKNYNKSSLLSPHAGKSYKEFFDPKLSIHPRFLEKIPLMK